ncbi:MAG: SPFH domain-containing protein [Clostridia bacterium]|nr:SPFH domain-containing protein [Clostridia bacterium]
MGLIRALAAGTSTVLADQWREYFTCDSLAGNVLVAKGQFKTKKRGLFGARNKATEDIITNGSVISVNEGQVALIVSDGKIVDFCAEAGYYKWDSSTEPSMLCGDFFRGLVDSFKRIGYRFTFGGDAGSQQRVYYVNTKEILDNKFGTTTPMPYDDPYYKTALYIRYFGQYTFRITDPIVFFSSIAGNVGDVYTSDDLKATATDEFMTALDSALARLSAEGIKFSQLPIKQREIASYMSDTLDTEWRQRRGIEIVAVALAKVTPDEDSRKRIEEFDTNVMHAAPDAMAGGMAYAQMRAMRDAANNAGGAMTGFMGVGMAAGAMGVRGQETLLSTAAELESKRSETAAVKCTACGAAVSGKFCPECGAPAPTAEDEWTCTCGAVSRGKFCSECGTPRPAGYVCSCGYKAASPFKFCPECGKKA